MYGGRGMRGRRLPRVPTSSYRTPAGDDRPTVADAPRPSALRSVWRAWAVAIVLSGAACGRDTPAPAPPVTSAPPAPAAAPVPAPVPPPAAAVGWDAAAGVALVVPGPADDALLISPGAPDAAGVDTVRTPSAAALAVLPADVALFAAQGLVGHARAVAAASGAATPAAGCGGWGWPRVRLGPASGADVLPAWAVGFAAAPGTPAPVPLPLDSLDRLAGADSARLVAALTRLAAALPEPTSVDAATRAALRGVPFRVRRAREFAPDARTRAVVAALTRTMNHEAAPAADALLLVAERPANAGPDALRLAYSERAAGAEESLPAAEVLAAVRLGASGASDGSTGLGPRAALVVGREADDGVRYTLLERAEPGRWRARWTSARPAKAARGCAR